MLSSKDGERYFSKKDELTKVLKIFKIVKTKIIANKSIENDDSARYKIMVSEINSLIHNLLIMD